MVRRMAARYISRRLSSNGKILSEEEKAAENVYIKELDVSSFLHQKMEKERLEKLAHKGEKPGEQPSTVKGAPEIDVKSSPSSGSTAGVSTDKNRNYAVVAGTVAIVSTIGWYLASKPKKSEEVQE